MQSNLEEQFVRDDLNLHIYSQALLSNLAVLKGLCKETTKVCAVVKANAYGHGQREVVSILKDAQVDFFGVANVYEALFISDLVESQNILIFEPIHSAFSPELIKSCAEKNFHFAATCPELLEKISEVLASLGGVLNLHVKVETGMGRCGVRPEQAQNLIKIIDKSKNLHLAGVYTHLATSDEQDLSFANEQLARFTDFLDANKLNKRQDIIIHAANSGGAVNLPHSHFDMIRPGIALYGYVSADFAQKQILKPVCSLDTSIVQMNKFSKGQTIGYGRSFQVKRDTIGAVIPIGYADGYRRLFSNKTVMKVADSFCPLIGRISMDKCVIDVTDVADIAVGQPVTVIDDSHSSPCSVYALAKLAGTICNDILTSISPRAKRIIH